jgi:hypothetical protein
MNNSQGHGITIDSFISWLTTQIDGEGIEGSLSLPTNHTTNLVLSTSRQFLSLPQTNERMRHALINELLPKIELEPVKQLFINLLNEYPANFQRRQQGNIDNIETHAIEDNDDGDDDINASNQNRDP